MATELQIINRALRHLGARPITALGDGSSNAQVIDDTWEGVRQEFLCDNPWRGATNEQSVTERADKPPEGTGWGTWYDLDTLDPLPLDVHSVNRRPREEDRTVFWEIRDHPDEDVRVLLTNASSPIRLLYARDLDDAGLQNLERATAGALSWYLAADIANNFGKTLREQQELMRMAEDMIVKAKGINSQQQKRRPRQQRSPLVEARLTRSSPRFGRGAV